MCRSSFSTRYEIKNHRTRLRTWDTAVHSSKPDKSIKFRVSLCIHLQKTTSVYEIFNSAKNKTKYSLIKSTVKETENMVTTLENISVCQIVEDKVNSNQTILGMYKLQFHYPESQRERSSPHAVTLGACSVWPVVCIHIEASYRRARPAVQLACSPRPRGPRRHASCVGRVAVRTRRPVHRSASRHSAQPNREAGRAGSKGLLR